MKSESLVAPCLWVGSIPEFGERVGKHFDRLLILANESTCYTDLYPGISLFHVPLNEDRLIVDEDKAVQLGRIVSGWTRKNLNVLVACKHGLNRAGFIAGIALVSRGVPALEAVQKIRAARGPMALNGPHFQRTLQRLEDNWSLQRPIPI